MNTWIDVKAKYDKPDKKGVKLTTDTFLVDALTCTEAEGRVMKELMNVTQGELSVISNGMTNISRVFLDYDGAAFYKAKIFYQAGDKKNVTYVVVKGKHFEDAYRNLADALEKHLPDYEPVSLTETNIVNVFTYDAVSDEP